jgi:hypothetical protein
MAEPGPGPGPGPGPAAAAVVAAAEPAAAAPDFGEPLCPRRAGDAGPDQERQQAGEEPAVADAAAATQEPGAEEPGGEEPGAEGPAGRARRAGSAVNYNENKLLATVRCVWRYRRHF